jgi:hypothetical protein
MLAGAVRAWPGFALLVFAAGRGDGLARGRLTTSERFTEEKVLVCLLKEHRHWPLENQARGSRLGSL